MTARLDCLLFSAMLTLVVACDALAASLCGTRYQGRGDLEQALRSRGGRFFAGKDVRTVFVDSPTRLSLWWVTYATSRAYPAIACVEKVQAADGSLRQREAEADCDGAARAACEGLRREIAKAKF
jgi:hypothetical protein